MTDKQNKRRVFNADTAERERTFEDFVVIIGGREITMTDPQELSWQQLMDIEKPIHFFRYVVNDEDREFVRRQHIEGWKMNDIIDAYMRHFGLDKAGNGGASSI